MKRHFFIKVIKYRLRKIKILIFLIMWDVNRSRITKWNQQGIRVEQRCSDPLRWWLWETAPPTIWRPLIGTAIDEVPKHDTDHNPLMVSHLTTYNIKAPISVYLAYILYLLRRADFLFANITIFWDTNWKLFRTKHFCFSTWRHSLAGSRPAVARNLILIKNISYAFSGLFLSMLIS